MSEFAIGLRVLGPLTGRRQRVGWRRAFDSYLACEPQAQVATEAYLSVFTFPPAMTEHLRATGSPAGYVGETFAEVLPFDIDRKRDIPRALQDTRTLVAVLEETYGVPPSAINVFYSGSKGFHVLIPTTLWSPVASVSFSRTLRFLAERLAAEAKVEIDSSIYNRVHVIRAPNSRHPATGLFKVPLTVEQLDGLGLADIQRLAQSPIPTPPQQIAISSSAVILEEWNVSLMEVVNAEEAKVSREAVSAHSARLTRLTKSIVRGESLEEGNRHRYLYSAAANLAECGASLGLVEQLLMDVGRESGLPPRDVEKQIRDGHARGDSGL